MFRDGAFLDRSCLSLEEGFVVVKYRTRCGGGLPGMIAGLGASTFSGFHWFGLPSHGLSGRWFVPYVSVSR